MEDVLSGLVCPEFGYCAPSDQKNRFCDLAPAGVTVWAEIGRPKNRFFHFLAPGGKIS